MPPVYSPNSDPRDLPRTAFTARAGAPLDLPALVGAVDADVAIVGGGITGASAALHAAGAGASVVVLEANAVGWGASGRNAGHVAPASKLSLDEAVRRYGPLHGPRFNEACEAGPDLVFGLAERHGFDAGVRRGGVIVAAHSPAAAAELSARAEVMAREGKPVRFLDRDEAARQIGSRLYLGAFKDERGGAVNAMAYVRGLVRTAIGFGARVFEDSRALSIAADGPRWIIRTARGQVTATRVILCTNAYADDLWPGLRRTVVPARSYHFATEPLSEAVARSVLPGAAVMTDRRRLLIGLRVTSDLRIHFNGYGPPVGHDTGPDLARSVARLEEIFPQLAPVRLDPEIRWSGWMAMSLAGTWKLHRLAPGVTAALGCNGRGVAMGTTFGRDLARDALGEPETALTIPFEPMRPLPFHGLSPFVAARWVAAKDRKDVREMAGLRRRGR
ncbi:NAD(P)/FAD-dependent oxidoreductase [Tistrella mobilis]|uniref:NAD(P)/FAD-dependent oxidoreductase n=1 Tax=Tistrella mobilis TaxID=171437 RepID=UPI00355794DE